MVRAMTVPDRSLKTSWLRMSTGRWPACSRPRTRLRSAQRSSPLREKRFLICWRPTTSLWPAVIALWVASALACVWLVSSPFRSHDRWISGLLGVHWAWFAIAYHMTFFVRINPAAWLFAVLFMVQAALFVWFGLIKRDLSFPSSRTAW